jgi:hypothetical protein
VSTAPTTRHARRAVRVGVAAVPAVSVLSVLSAPPALAATPTTWGEPAPMSPLEALLIYGGIPLGLMAVITVLVMAPSLVRGDRQQRGVASWTEPQWFGGPGDAVPADRRTAPAEVTTGEDEPAQAGGASARW